MKKSTRKLISLINQLLDFRRVESDTYKLNFSRCSVSAIIRESVREFSYEFKENDRQLVVDLPADDIYAHVNPEALNKILCNLLGNGVKYSDRCLKLSASVDGDRLLVTVSNDGVLVPSDMREEIFKPFVRYSPDHRETMIGTGIGLVLSRSLAELHGGTLKMSDSLTENEFVLSIPMNHDGVSLDEAEMTETKSETGRCAILVIEDDQDMRDFIKKGLSSHYDVAAVSGGEDGLKILESKDIDIIITDRMMPGMDGLDFCRAVKKNVNISHIPIIVLTADTSLQTKIDSMESGAEVFMEKPFSLDYLRASINTLFENRKKMRQALIKGPFSLPVSSSANDKDREFINRLSAIIAENYSEQEFRIDDVAEMVGMSKSNFYRKIKGVMDMTPNDLLRMERLKKATELFAEGRYRINEVCYSVGFSSPSYFAKCFQKQYGLTPKEFISKQRTIEQ